MSAIGSIKPAAAKNDPASVYKTPLDLVDEVMLTRGEKIATLERWRQAVMQQLSAADDGMQTQGVGDKLAQTLGDIGKALSMLQSPISGAA